MEPPWEDPQPGSPGAAKGVPSPPCRLDALSCQTLTWHQQPRVTEESPGCWDVALGLCLGMEELQHHGSTQWDSVVVFSRGDRSKVGRGGREKHEQLSPGCDLPATSSLPQAPSRARQGLPAAAWGTAQHPHQHRGTHQPCRTAQH